MEVQIRQAEKGRLEEYVQIMRDSKLYDRYYKPDENRLYAILQDALDREALFIAERSDGQAAGLMICEWKGMLGAFPYLALLGVRKDCRGMGVGHKLIKTFEAISRELKARNTFICVSSFNPRARALYVSLGYRKIAQVPDCFVNGIEENILMKRLL